MEISIVPKIIRTEDVHFFDDNNVEIFLCRPSQFRFINPFRKPFLVIDNYNKDKNKIEDIRKIDLTELHNLGFRLVSLNTRGLDLVVRPRQAKIYMLEEKSNPIPKSQILNRIPKEHLIEFDMENKRIRIKGKNAYPYMRAENASQWRDVKK